MRIPKLGFTAVIVIMSCKASDLESPLVDLANRLYLDGSWTWSDSTTYHDYIPSGESVPHHGSYIVSGTATLEPLDSTKAEQYLLTATADLVHVDSTATAEVTSWVVPGIQYDDTVEVRGDSIFGLAVEPIPPEAGPNTNLVRWILGSDQLWCTNWLTDTLPAGNADNCETVIRWDRDSPRVP